VTPGFFAGWVTIAHTLELGDADHGTSYGTNEFYKADGTLYRTGCDGGRCAVRIITSVKSRGTDRTGGEDELLPPRACLYPFL